MLVPQSPAAPDGVSDPLPEWPAGEFAADLAQALRRDVLAVVTDAAGHIVHVNDELASLLGRTRADLEGRVWYEVAVVRSDRNAVQRMFEAVDGAGGHVEAELRDADGNMRTVAWASHRTADENGGVIAVTTVGIEVTGPQVVMRSHPVAGPNGSDPLTGVADRETFMRELEAQVATANRAGYPLGLILVNIDRFRSVTETLGLETGDLLLREVATRIQRCAGQRMVARISGDEFAVILPRVRTSGDAVAVAECIVASMRTPCTSLVSPVHLGASAGIALSPHDAEEATTLLRHASVALRRAKEAGGDGFSLYVQELGDRAKDRMVLEQQLHGAVNRKEIEVFYQPLIEAGSKRIVGVEALARWFHPVLGEISPARFIPVAEETGMIRSLGLHVMRTALEELAAWMDAGLGSLTVAVNVSARQLIQPGLVEDILRILDETKVPPELLEIEVTETAVLVDAELAAQTLRSLGALGIAISLDDFGTGYSCIARLNDLSVTTIKIDRSFISSTTTVPDSGAFVRALVALARSLDLRVIAEGVETQEQLERLEAEGCDVYQGFLFARPMPAGQLRRLLEASPTLTPS